MSILSNCTLIGDIRGSINWNVGADGTVIISGNATFTHEGFAAAVDHLSVIAGDARNLHATHTRDAKDGGQ